MTARGRFGWIDVLSVAGLVAAIYVAYELLRRADWTSLTLENALVASMGIPLGVVALLLSGAALATTAASLSGAPHLPLVHAIYAANRTVLAKYLPGKIWYVLGMSEILVHAGLARGRAWIVVTLYQGILIVTALALGVAAGFALGADQPVSTMLATMPFSSSIVGIAIVAAVLAFVLVCGIYRRWRSTVPRLHGSWLICGAAISVMHWLLQGVAIWLVLSLLYGTWLDWATVLVVPAVYAAGFLVLIAPGGVGVRELLFLQFFIYLGLSTEVSATLAITARVVALVIESATWLLLHTIPRRLLPGAANASA